MKGKIREKRKVIFKQKIITPTIIRRFAAIIQNEAGNDNSVFPDNILIVYSIDATDNSSYESQSIEIFSDGGIIDSKIVERISMRFQTFDNSKNIEIQFRHTNAKESKDNYINVSGDNPIWVNGILSQFSEILSLTENQKPYKTIIEYSTLPVTIIFNIIYFRIFYPYFSQINNGWIALFFILIIPGVSLYVFDAIEKYLVLLWPNVELQSGPHYLQSTVAKRKKLKWIITAILIPLILGLIYDLLKNGFHLIHN